MVAGPLALENCKIQKCPERNDKRRRSPY
jgi:hypothetical protein